MSGWRFWQRPVPAPGDQATQVVGELDEYVRRETTAQAATLIRSALTAVQLRVDAVGQAYVALSKRSVTPTADVIDNLADIRNEITRQLRIVEGMGEQVRRG